MKKKKKKIKWSCFKEVKNQSGKKKEASFH